MISKTAKVLLAAAAAVAVTVTALPDASAARRVEVRVDEKGYHPGTINAEEGERLKLVFTRTSDKGCGKVVVFPDLDIRRELPLNEPVSVTVPVDDDGKLRFTCGMGMYDGKIVVE